MLAALESRNPQDAGTVRRAFRKLLHLLANNREALAFFLKACPQAILTGAWRRASL